MRDWADFSLEADGRGTVTLAFSGPLRIWSLGDLDLRLDAVQDAVDRIDLGGVTSIDTAGAWLAWHTASRYRAQIIGTSEEARRLIAAVSRTQAEDHAARRAASAIVRALDWLGRRMASAYEGLVGVLGFIGAMILSMGDVIREPGRLRLRALVHQMELVGVTAIGIVGLMSFLVGIVIAQQGAVQLRQFGAEIYTINLTGRLALRELGILMTAIMVAGRSGSAFAAQIGTMRLTEEVDAMRTIGVSPMEALVIPRVLAAMLMMPLLGLYASLVSIVGGAFISAIVLEIPFFTFLARIQEVVPTHDIWVGMIKAPVFGFIIAVAGCYNGMQVKGNSEEVGRRTTQAVVAAIFMVIVLDAFFAVFFSEVGWE